MFQNICICDMTVSAAYLCQRPCQGTHSGTEQTSVSTGGTGAIKVLWALFSAFTASTLEWRKDQIIWGSWPGGEGLQLKKDEEEDVESGKINAELLTGAVTSITHARSFLWSSESSFLFQFREFRPRRSHSNSSKHSSFVSDHQSFKLWRV